MTGSAPLAFVVRPEGDEVRVAVTDVDAFACVRVERLELAAPASGRAEAQPARLQRLRTRLAGLTLRVEQRGLDRHLATRATALARAGFGQVRGRIGEGDLAFTSRVSDGLATADVSFRVTALARGAAVRALAHTIRVHGHLPTPGPLLAHRLLELCWATARHRPTRSTGARSAAGSIRAGGRACGSAASAISSWRR